MNNNELDRVLKEWGERNQPDVETLARLEVKIREPIPHEKLDMDTVVEESIRASGWPRWIAMAAGLSILLVGTLLWNFHRDSDSPYAATGNGAAEFARISTEQAAAGRVLLEELDALFDGQLRWVRLDAKEMHLEMEETFVPHDSSRIRLVVRTVIVERKIGQTEWKSIWSSDVLTRTEEYVKIEAGTESAGELELWVHPLPDGRFVMDSEIEWSAARLLRPYDAQVFTAGQPQQVLVHTMADREYRIYQSVEPLENGQG